MTGDDPEPGGQSQGVWAKVLSFFGRDQQPDNLAAAIENGDNGATAGLSLARREMIERVVAFDEKTVFDVMAPRADIFAVDLDTELDDLVRLFAEAGHSRMPIYRGDLDDPIGMAHIKDVVAIIAKNGSAVQTDDPVLKSIRRDVLYVPPSMKVTDLLLRMQASRVHMALVIDEYGGTDGLVTIEDLVEEIVGEINDEHDDEETIDVTPLPGGGWETNARAELEIFAAETGVRLDTEDEEIDTVGGYVVSIAGRVPQRGEVFPGPNGFEIEVIEGDARKVRKLRIRPAAASISEAAE